MKITRNEYAPEEWHLEINDRCFFDPINDWRDVVALFKHSQNWYDFRLIRIEFTNDVIAPGYEVICILLGLGFRFRYNKDWTDTPIQRMIDDALQAAEEGRLVDWEELFTDDQ